MSCLNTDRSNHQYPVAYAIGGIEATGMMQRYGGKRFAGQSGFDFIFKTLPR